MNEKINGKEGQEGQQIPALQHGHQDMTTNSRGGGEGEKRIAGREGVWMRKGQQEGKVGG